MPESHARLRRLWQLLWSRSHSPEGGHCGWCTGHACRGRPRSVLLPCGSTARRAAAPGTLVEASRGQLLLLRAEIFEQRGEFCVFAGLLRRRGLLWGDAVFWRRDGPRDCVNSDLVQDLHWHALPSAAARWTSLKRERHSCANWARQPAAARCHLLAADGVGGWAVHQDHGRRLCVARLGR